VSQQINLFNPLFLKQKKIFSATTMAQALGAVLVVCVLASFYVGWQGRIREKQAADSTAQLAKLKTALDNATLHYTPHAADASLDAQIDKAQADVRSLESVQAALNGGGFGDTKGYSIYFRSFSRQIVNGVWLTGIDINGAGQQIDLRGRALQAELVPEYLQRLGRESEMKSKTFATLDMRAPPPPDPKSEADNKAKDAPAVPYVEFDLESIEGGKKDEKERAK
jgi:Tfp pilus assembly protein PilN